MTSAILEAARSQSDAGASSPHTPGRLTGEQHGVEPKPQPQFQALLVDALTTPGRVSEAYSLFHGYSIGNALWVAEQLACRGEPLAPIATFNRWRELGRMVKKGSKALCMSMPVAVKAKTDQAARAQADETDATPGRFVFFVARRNWFALHQTEPVEGAEPQTIETARPDWNAERALEALKITREDFQHMDGNVQGYARPAECTVAVSPLASLPHKTLFHELAHCLLHAGESRIVDGVELGRDVREVEAEATAFICCAVLGLPGLEESRGYVQAWLAGTDTAEFADRHARRIFGAADRILKAGRAAAAA